MVATHGLGTYGNGVGTVTPEDHKLAQAGLVTKTVTGAIRAGVFWGGNPTLVAGKPNMSYDVAAFTAATTRGATSGAILIANDGVVNVTTTAAPGSNSRYDVVYIWQREFALDGTNSEPVIGVLQGAVASSPTAPSLAAFPGAIELARILVPAGVTATNTGTTITQTAPLTAAAGGTVPFRSKAEMDATTNLPSGTEAQIIGGGRYRFDGSTWADALGDTGWAAASLQNLWVNFGGGLADAAYRRIGGIVYLRGTIKDGSLTNGTLLFTLPAGFRPASTLRFMLLSNTANAVAHLSSAGALTFSGAAPSNASVALDGVRFVAEQ